MRAPAPALPVAPAWPALAGVLARCSRRRSSRPRPRRRADEVVERPADGVFVVEGHGWGHGRGMSQWGAQGAASLGVERRDDRAHLLPGHRAGRPAGRADPGAAVTATRAGTPVVVAGARAGRHRPGTGTRAGSCRAAPSRWRVDRRRRGPARAVADRRHLDAVRPRRRTPRHAGPLRFSGPTFVRVALAGGTSRDYRGAVQAVQAVGVSAADGRRAAARGLPARRRAARVVVVVEAGRAAGAGHRRPLLQRQQARRVAGRGTLRHLRHHAVPGLRRQRALQRERHAAPSWSPRRTTAAVRATAGVVRTYDGRADLRRVQQQQRRLVDRRRRALPARPARRLGRAVPNTVHAWTAVAARQPTSRRSYPAVGTCARLRVTAPRRQRRVGRSRQDRRARGRRGSGAPPASRTTGAGGLRRARDLARRGPTAAIHAGGDIAGGRATERQRRRRAVRRPDAGPAARRRHRAADRHPARTPAPTAWPTDGLHLAVASPAGERRPAGRRLGPARRPRPQRQPPRRDDASPRASAPTSPSPSTPRACSPACTAGPTGCASATAPVFGATVSWRVPVEAPS